MTILEAFKSDIPENWNIKDSKLERRLLKRGLTPSDEIKDEHEKNVELAFADLMVVLSNSINVDEGGVKLSIPSPEILRKNASGIYSKWGVSDPSKASVKFINPW